ncbi:NAD(P)/FAD-dependent oxidoreductase [uncultured Bradyrhizobium sp.]|uniref:NAD(P)/FAD-dependent oxidoreductase n=1 Tax=Bradyrhizobium sp. TaxID=376 RepID=UPI0026109641|nr:NAD(P)/FAD-dependent oxidoreductase [uncultured Bradyrhizobium sp.]
MNAADAATSIIETDFLLIGGGIAAVTAAQTLRNEGAKGGIILLGAEPVPPYNCPLLTKNIVTGELRPDQIPLLPPERYAADEIALRLGTAARNVHPSDHRVTDHTGVVYQYRKLLIATGARPRELDVPGAGLDGIFKFRTLADALALRKWVSAAPGARAVVIGTSFIGMEIATSLVRIGIRVTMIDQAATVFPKVQSPRLSAYFLDRCKRYGIDVLLEDRVRAFHGTGRVAEVETLSGQHIACGSVILAVGAVPQTAFLEGSGLRVEDGVVVDEFLQASFPDIFAAGDVATYPDPIGVWQRTSIGIMRTSRGTLPPRICSGSASPTATYPTTSANFSVSASRFSGRAKEPSFASAEVASKTSHSPSSTFDPGRSPGSSQPGGPRRRRARSTP